MNPIASKIIYTLLPTFLRRLNIQSEKVISDKYKFIWVGIPKVATRSFLTAFIEEAPYDFGALVTTESLPKLLARNPSYKSYFKFTFVRNPWSRLVSCYLDKILNPKQKTIDLLLSKYSDLSPNISFEEFVDYLFKGIFGPDKRADTHWLSQHMFFTDLMGNSLVNYIGKYENLANDFDAISKEIGLPTIKLPWLNTKNGWDPGNKATEKEDIFYYRTYYTDTTKNMVAKRYRKDIDLLNYHF